MKIFYPFLLLPIFFFFACGTVKLDENNSVRQLPSEYSGLKKMILIESGFFWMGSNAGNEHEKPVHEVFLDAFYMDETPVTFGDFEKYISAGGSPSFFDNSYRSANSPAVGVMWHQAADYCNWRSKKEGFKPVYTETGLKDVWGYPIFDADFSADGYRLPTEAEFEYAARGGLHQKNYVWGDVFDDKKANIDTESGFLTGKRQRLTQAKLHPKNNFGLYEMCGNIWQWCNDWYAPDYYQFAAEKNPKGELSGRCKVLRGASWGTAKRERAGVYARSMAAPSNYNYDIGFRCVRPALPMPAQMLQKEFEHDFFFPDIKPHLSPIKNFDDEFFWARLTAYIRDNYHNSIYFHRSVDAQNITTPEETAKIILQTCASNHINPAFLTAVMAAESGFGVCSMPRWYNNPMAFRWQNSLIKNGEPLYTDSGYRRNRRFRHLREGFEAFCHGLRRNAYTDAAHKDLYDFHLVYVGYEAKEWIFIVKKVYRDLLCEEIDLHLPSADIGTLIYTDWDSIKEKSENTKNQFLLHQGKKIGRNVEKLSPQSNHFYLVCGSFDDYDDAFRLKLKMIRKGFFKTKILNGGNVFRVSIVDSKNHAEINEKKNKLQSQFSVLWVWKN
jgi:formylglycine-generating enzyme required for sulfatase activity